MSRSPYDSLEYDIYERLRDYVADNRCDGVTMIDTIARVQVVLSELVRNLADNRESLDEQSIRADERSKVIESMRRLLQ